MRTLAMIRAVTDPVERARAAQTFLERGRGELRDVIAIRDEAVAELRDVNGLSQRKVAALLGLSPAAVALIDEVRR